MDEAICTIEVSGDDHISCILWQVQRLSKRHMHFHNELMLQIHKDLRPTGKQIDYEKAKFKPSANRYSIACLNDLQKLIADPPEEIFGDVVLFEE
eukprot:8833411-Pyramimonas_sp.AAC.1